MNTSRFFEERTRNIYVKSTYGLPHEPFLFVLRHRDCFMNTSRFFEERTRNIYVKSTITFLSETFVFHGGWFRDATPLSFKLASVPIGKA